MTQPHPTAHLAAALPNPTPGPTTDRETAWHETAEFEIEAAWWDGYHTALADIAERRAELATTWARTAHVLYRDRTAQRLAEMEASAAALHTHLGTTEWAGLNNGATLPTADWGTTTRALHAVPNHQEAA